MTPPFSVANLPAGVLEPGVYVGESVGDVGPSAPGKACLIFGYMSAGGTGTVNMPVRATSQADVDAAFRPYSMISHAYAAAKSQIPVGAEVWLCPLSEPSGGTAQVVNITFQGEPVAGVLSTATAAAAADTVSVRLRGRGVNVGIKAGDTWANIATNVKAALDAIEGLQVTVGISTGTITLTSRHKGLFDDGAVEVSFASRGASGCAASLGTMVVANAAGGTGTVVVAMGSKSATVSVTSGDTAIVTGSAIVAKLNSDAYPIRAAQPSSASGTVTLFFVNGRPVRPLSVSSTETGITTQTVTDSVGTAGAGVPTLTSALANLAASADVYKVFSPFWTSTSECSSLVTHIEAEAAIPVLKGQIVVFPALTGSYSVVSAANLPAATTPKMTATARHSVLWAQAAPNAGWELSARLAAAIAAESVVQRNWNGFEFVGSDAAPLVAIHPADLPTRDERNQSIALRHSPITVNGSGSMALVWGGNAYAPKGFKDSKFCKISDRLTRDYMIKDLISRCEYLTTKKVKLSGAPRTAQAVDMASVKALVYRICKDWDDRDIFDGAVAARDAIMAAVVTDPKRIDINAICRTLADIDIVAFNLVAE